MAITAPLHPHHHAACCVWCVESLAWKMELVASMKLEKIEEDVRLSTLSELKTMQESFLIMWKNLVDCIFDSDSEEEPEKSPQRDETGVLSAANMTPALAVLGR
eukprot:gene33935-43622_t